MSRLLRRYKEDTTHSVINNKVIMVLKAFLLNDYTTITLYTLAGDKGVNPDSMINVW